MGRLAQSGLPSAFPDLDLAKTARCQLGDQGRKQVVGQARDRLAGRAGTEGLVRGRHRRDFAPSARSGIVYSSSRGRADRASRATRAWRTAASTASCSADREADP